MQFQQRREEKDLTQQKELFKLLELKLIENYQILNKAIEDGVNKLNKGGRMAIITFPFLRR